MGISVVGAGDMGGASTDESLEIQRRKGLNKLKKKYGLRVMGRGGREGGREEGREGGEGGGGSVCYVSINGRMAPEIFNVKRHMYMLSLLFIF